MKFKADTGKKQIGVAGCRVTDALGRTGKRTPLVSAPIERSFFISLALYFRGGEAEEERSLILFPSKHHSGELLCD